MSTTLAEDRRTHPRVPLIRPCKVFVRSTRRYLPAQTCDVSSGGALLRVLAPRPLTPGEDIDVYIAWNNRSLLTTAEQVRGTVTRTLFDGVEQVVAIRFASAVGAMSRTAAA